jgi:hypothetical protein
LHAWFDVALVPDARLLRKFDAGNTAAACGASLFTVPRSVGEVMFVCFGDHAVSVGTEVCCGTVVVAVAAVAPACVVQVLDWDDDDACCSEAG